MLGIMFFSLPIIKWAGKLLISYLPQDDFFAACCIILFIWFSIMSILQKYIIIPLCFKIENYVGVRGATNLNNPNRDLL